MQAAIRTFYPKILAPRVFPLVLMFPLAILFALSFVVGIARAEDPPALGAALLSLFTVIKDKAAAAIIVMHAFQILRTNEVIGILGKLGLQGKGLRVAIALITALGYVANAYATSGNLGAAVIEGLFTAGGAMLIFDAFKAETAKVAEKGDVVVLSALNQKKASVKA